MVTFKTLIRSTAYLLIKGLPRSFISLGSLQNKAQTSQKTLHVVIMTGGLGDIIASDPALRHLRKHEEFLVVLIRPNYLSMFQFNPGVDSAVGVGSYVEAMILQNRFKSSRWTNLHVDHHRCNAFAISIRNKFSRGITADNYYEGRTLSDVYSHIATGKTLPDRPLIYPDLAFDFDVFLRTNFLVPANPILIVHTQAMEKVRSLPARTGQEVVAWLLDNTKFNVIEFGLDPILQRGPRVCQTTDCFTLSQQAAVMIRATIFLGVDSGFAHMANAAGIPSILLLAAYKKFSEYLPWKLNPDDILLRTPQAGLEGLVADQIILALSELIAKCTSPLQ